MDVHCTGGFLDAHDGRSAVAPQRDRRGVARRLRQIGQQRRGQAHRVVLLQADQAELQRQRPESVAAGGVLLDQPELAEAHQIGMRLARGHVGFVRQVLERQRTPDMRQRQQQPAADFDALDAARAADRTVVGGGRGHIQGFIPMLTD
ncbi:hypothetical protein GALL_374280 [mine drainage metagenome]|uniref:Uncharacterized protein n=1 Tax=mine drainage metagenome TaxID=410659 RepID=A0A1J5QAX5_9ZZZZ